MKKYKVVENHNGVNGEYVVEHIRIHLHKL